MKACRFRGITLIELLVVLALIGLLSGIAGPAVVRQLDAIALQSTTTQLAAELRKAQSEARAYDIPIAMTYADHTFRFWKNAKPVATFQLPPAISPVRSDLSAYLFLPSGQIVGADQIELENTRGRKTRIKTDLLSGIAYE
jgi:type II secretion system protein H